MSQEATCLLRLSNHEATQTILELRRSIAEAYCNVSKEALPLIISWVGNINDVSIRCPPLLEFSFPEITLFTSASSKSRSTLHVTTSTSCATTSKKGAMLAKLRVKFGMPVQLPWFEIPVHDF